jgi:hypothetical protein
MNRVVVNVATGPHYIKGQERLTEALAVLGEDYQVWRDKLPPGSPAHEEIPYAFKAWALEAARKSGHTLLMWADAAIVPIAKLDAIWQHTEVHGVWLADNGWKNSQWTCDAAYPILAPELFPWNGSASPVELKRAREVNRKIKHVVATAFALDLAHKNGAMFFMEYLRLAKTNAFKGPWWNSDGEREDYRKIKGAEPCGPPECLGHRHDQTAASVIAWRLGIPLTTCPRFFSYDGQQTDETILVARGI